MSIKVYKNKAWEVFEKLSLNRDSKIPMKNDKWKVSYISSSSFTKNKNAFHSHHSLCSDKVYPTFFCMRQNYRSMSKCFITVLQLNSVQSRHFKTDRNIKAELDRNPPFSTRFRKWFGLNTHTVSTYHKTHTLTHKISVLMSYMFFLFFDLQCSIK